LPESALQDLWSAIVSDRFRSPFVLEKTALEEPASVIGDSRRLEPRQFSGYFPGLNEDEPSEKDTRIL
jgi:hypothetical protein